MNYKAESIIREEVDVCRLTTNVGYKMLIKTPEREIIVGRSAAMVILDLFDKPELKAEASATNPYGTNDSFLTHAQRMALIQQLEANLNFHSSDNVQAKDVVSILDANYILIKR